MNELVDFIRAQLARDEQVAREALEQTAPEWRTYFKQIIAPGSRHETEIAEAETSEAAAHIARHDPARVLAEVEAKRKVVAWVELQQVPNSTIGDDFAFALYALALPYADEPGYRDEWRPEPA